jgi:TP901 family phage tail tape measure protein
MAERLQALKNSFQEMATRVGEALIPVLENVMKKLEPIIQKVSDWIAENPELASKILLI